ncbi:MAG: AAA family ATPase [Clostridia bacterium]|nr:AAA family ATPase [Clostridia bacterium]
MTVFRRKAMDKLKEWKDKYSDRFAVLVEGARGVGKTTAVKEFAERNYDSYILIDFSEPREEVNELFRNVWDTDAFFEKLESIYGVKLVPGHSAIIFDEVQCFGQARQSIELLVKDGRFAYMETGTLLMVCAGRDHIRTGGEDHLTMYPMDFEEFLWALHGNDETVTGQIEGAFNRFRPLGQDLHQSIMEDFRKYLLVGGMPQAVAAFASGAEKGFACAEAVKRGILAQYMADIAKFGGSVEERARIEAVFNRLPVQLAEKDKTLNLSKLSPGASLEDYDEAIFWLKDAGILIPSCPCGKPDGMLFMDLRYSSIECFMMDTGLLATLQYAVCKPHDMYLHDNVLKGHLGVDEGMLMENMAAQMLAPSRNRKLFFYRHFDKAAKKTDMESDFMIYRGLKVCPLDVRCGTACSFEAYNRIRGKYTQYIGKGYILHTGDLAVKDTVYYLPVYMGMFL